MSDINAEKDLQIELEIVENMLANAARRLSAASQGKIRKDVAVFLRHVAGKLGQLHDEIQPLMKKGKR